MLGHFSVDRQHFARGGRTLGSGRQLPPQLTVGRRPLGGGGGHLRGGGVQVGQLGVVVGGGGSGWAIWGVGGGGAQAPLTSLALPLTIPSP